MNFLGNTQLPSASRFVGTQDTPANQIVGTRDALMNLTCGTVYIQTMEPWSTAPESIPVDEDVKRPFSIHTKSRLLASELLDWWLHKEPDSRTQVQDLADQFRELADQWEEESMFLSNSEQIIALPSYDAIVRLGEQAVPLILKRMQAQGGHWYHVLQDITKEDPVDPADWGNVAAMQKEWLRWGQDNGRI